MSVKSITFQHITHEIIRRQNYITLYGRCEDGESCAVHIADFTPYIYIKTSMEVWGRVKNAVLTTYRLCRLREKHQTNIRFGYDSTIDFYGKRSLSFLKSGPRVYDVEKFEGYNIRERHEEVPDSFVKLTARDDAELRIYITIFKNLKHSLKTAMEYLDTYMEHDETDEHASRIYDQILEAERCFKNIDFTEMETFEGMFDSASLLFIDQNIKPCGWLTIDDAMTGTVRLTTCGKEFVKGYNTHSTIIRSATNHPILAPIKFLSYDIEAIPPWPKFPTADRDAICTIGVVCYQFVTEETEMHVFTLGGIGKLTTEMEPSPDEFDAGCIINHCFDNEGDMLEEFAHFLRSYEPDIISGWNVNNFDNVYLFERMAKVCAAVGQHHVWGRRGTVRTQLEKKFTKSNQSGGREWWKCTVPGVVFFDMMLIFIQNHNLSSYKLDRVSQEFLQTRKVDIQYKDIGPMTKTKEGREKLAVYCVKDSWLPVVLCTKLSKLTNAFSLANVTGAPLNAILYQGQQIRVMNLLVRFLKEQKTRYFLPNGMRQGESFKGAFVLDPVPGFYNDPVICLDFASLYPSIMCANNMCYSTVCTREYARKHNFSFDGDDPEVIAIRDFESPEGGEFKLIDKEDDVCFIQERKRKGILPIVLQSLLSERKVYKKKKKEAKDKTQKSVYDGHQLALKVCANSVYGFTGASIGYLPESRIASSVTKRGRAMLYETKYNVETNFKGSKVIYGDTDSVFVKLSPSLFPKYTPEEFAKLPAEKVVQLSEELGSKMGELCTKAFRKPNDLEYEKCYLPYLLVRKKNYCGKKYEEGTVKIDMKGLESVRRDKSPIVRNTQREMLNILMETRDVKQCVDFVQKVIERVRKGDITMEEITLSKKLTKAPKDYTNTPEHVALARRLQKELPEAMAPRAGDRVDYVISTFGGKAVADRAIQPQEVGKTREIPPFGKVKLRVDTNYYLNNQLKKPLMRILSMLGKTEKDIFAGDSSTSRAKKPKRKRDGKIANYFTKVKR